MKKYLKTAQQLWSGRTSNDALYLHKKVTLIDLDLLQEDLITPENKAFAFLGYACDEGVRRNQGRVGAVDGADAIRKMLGKLPHHLAATTALYDYGTIHCHDGDLEEAQVNMALTVQRLLAYNLTPILLGGGHDIAYGHYCGIRNYVGNDKKIGILNFDAHFDLRSSANSSNSGTPFFQIAEDCKTTSASFHYLCLGIRSDANDQKGYETAKKLKVDYIANNQFRIENLEHITKEVTRFLDQIDYAYVTIDLDGFSSAYAPGVSAASPMGFAPDIVLEILNVILSSKKMISLDIAEMNPKYDRDDQTAKLAASLIHHVLHQIDKQ